MKYAPGRPVYCPLARQQHRHRKSPGGEVTAQSINLPPRPGISPRHLPTTLTHRHTHPRTVSLQTPATLYPNRGGSDELPQKSYGCFGPRDFRPCLSVFMFLLFRPCRNFQQIQERSNFPGHQQLFLLLKKSTFVLLCQLYTFSFVISMSAH